MHVHMTHTENQNTYVNGTSLLYRHAEPWPERLQHAKSGSLVVEPFSAFLYGIFYGYSGQKDLSMSLPLFSPKYLREWCRRVRNVTEVMGVDVGLAGKEYGGFDSGNL